MPEAQIVLPHGGYRDLIVYRKSEIVYQGTVVFCRRFLPAHGDRTVDQMVQAARSCKQNIVEGSSASGTSKETEIKLTNVARASLEELMEDYRDHLKARELSPWPLSDAKAVAAREFARTHNDWEAWTPLFATRSDETLANLMLTICHQTKFMLDRLIARQTKEFTKFGGVRERMRAARTAARSNGWDESVYAYLDAASTSAELDAHAEEIRRKNNGSLWSIKRRKGWEQGAQR